MPFPEATKKDEPKKSRQGKKLKYSRPTHRDKREVKNTPIAEKQETPKETPKESKPSQRKSLRERYMEAKGNED